MKDAIITSIIVGAMFIIALFAINGKSETKTQTYAVANDGEYLPIYKVCAQAMRINDTIEVEWNGNRYACEVYSESEIETGDPVMCTFTIYEGNVELIDIGEWE